MPRLVTNNGIESLEDYNKRLNKMKEINIEKITNNVASREFYKSYDIAIHNICFEFGKQLLELASENAEIEVNNLYEPFVSKQSILNTINQVK